MALPRKPERSQPIPNDPFESPEVASVKGPYWEMPLGSGLESDGQGSIQTSGSEPSAPTAYLYGTNGFVGVGSGLQIGPNGELGQGGGYIYCTPQFSELPVTYPPYGCETGVNTTGVTSFYRAWENCEEITEFLCVDSSSVTDFTYAWRRCYGITNFPTLNTNMGKSFYYSWAYTGLTSFPRLNTREGSNFGSAWTGCYYMTGEFPKLSWTNAVEFTYTWYGCGREAQEPISFPEGFFDSCVKNCLNFDYSWADCNLTQQSVDNIIKSLDGGSTLAGYLSMRYSGSMPSDEVTQINVEGLWGKGWVVILDDGNYGFDYPEYGCSTAVDPAGIEYLPRAWYGCSISSFPTLDVSSCKVFYGTWSNCINLTSFPVLDTSLGVNFQETWYYCINLTSFPELDLNSGVNFRYTWGGCTNLTSFPGTLDLSSGVNFQGTWGGCSSLTSFPGTLDLSSGTNFSFAWASCSSLTSFPGTLDLSSGTDFGGAWYNCSSLTSFPGTLDLSSGTNFIQTWSGCSSLTSFPTLDLSSGTNFYGTWIYCSSLTSFPAGMFDNCSAINFIGAWRDCALNQTSVNNILVSINAAGTSGGILSLEGGTSAAPSGAGLTAKAALQARGWTVATN